ncbi:hypothetical protein [Velocimicrobium porci]|uniref:HIRAN domain-containing protein n=1 Tax=Velocimicrobium porci TaxID=2606634 RepID=A0A6L5XYY7_9FIRM|nr:hypothetical protein [Velocimicrobium porci]MSS63153.1 hypothetical protein [Velocimicrobium porci]
MKLFRKRKNKFTICLRDIICIIFTSICAFFSSTSFLDFILKSVIGSIIFLFVIDFFYSEKSDTKGESLSTQKPNVPAETESEKIIKKYKFNVVGVTHKCKLDKSTKRQEILETCLAGEKLRVEKFLYQGKPAYLLVVDGWCKYDIGCVPAYIAEEIGDNYAFHKRVAYIEEIGDFENDKNKTIIYAKVSLHILDSSSPQYDECIV